METGKGTKAGKRPTKAFVIMMAGAFVLYFLMKAVQPSLPHVLFDYNTWDANRTDSVFWRILWMIGDCTEPHYIKTILGGIGILLGGFFAYYLDRKESKLRGTPIGYNTGTLWPWVLGCMFLSSAMAMAVFGGLHVDGDTYIPSYVAMVSISGAIVFLYGKGAAVMITGAACSAYIAMPITMWVRYNITLPYNLPGVMANVTGMWLGGIIAFELCRVLPWMHLENESKGVTPSRAIKGEMPLGEYKKAHPTKFFFRRFLCDLSEPMYMGSEWPAVFLIVGSFLSWALNPDQPFYGNGMFPELILCQIISTGLGLYVFWDQWMEKDSYGTFVAAVSAAPACIQIFGGSLPVVIIGAVLSGLFCPPFADLANRHIPKHWHAMFGNTFAMFVVSFVVIMIMKYIGIAFPNLY